ncbi:MAG: hypothetical protein Tsb0014_44290 [Pleurocapsa sp.]
MSQNQSNKTLKRSFKAKVSPEEYQLLLDLRKRSPAQNPPKLSLTLGERVADRVAEVMGSWRFIIIQSIILAIWVTLNIVAFIKHWDPYPFILLNLMLSFQAAYAAPIIMMSQNRQSAIDRQDAKHDYEVNLKSELEIELLHDKMNLLRESEIVALNNMLIAQQQQLERIENLLSQYNKSSSTSN